MMRCRFVVVVWALVAVAVSGIAWSQTAEAPALVRQEGPLVDAVTGRVVDTDGAPVAGMEFVLVPRGDLPPNQTLTLAARNTRTGDGMPRTFHRETPDASNARRASSDVDGRFHFGELDEHESYELFATPTSHTVLAFPNNGVCLVGEHVDLVAHELVEVTLEFTPVDGAPTHGLLVQSILSMRVATNGNNPPFGADHVVDAPRATLRLVRGIHSIEVTSWSGSNENKGIGGSAWFWKGAVEAGARDEPLSVTLAPRHHVDAYVRNNPFDRNSGLLVFGVVPAGSTDERPRFNERQVDVSMTASVAVARDTGPLVAQLRLPNGRLLMERPIELDRPRIALRFDLAGVDATPIFVRLGLPGDNTLDGLLVVTNVDMARRGDVPFQVESDGRLRFDSLVLSEAVREPKPSYGAPVLVFHHPRLGSLRVELQKDVHEYEAAFEATPLVRVTFVGEGAADVAATCGVTAGLVDPVDGFAPHHRWYPSNDGQNVMRDPATGSLTIEKLQPGDWRFEITLSPDPRDPDMFDHGRRLAVIDERLAGGEHAIEVRLPARHGIALWCPTSHARPSSVEVIGEGRRVELRTDEFGRVQVDGLFAGRYEVAVDDEGTRGRRFDITVPCEEVVWAGRPHDALRVAIARPDSPLAAAGLQDGDLVIGFDGLTFRQQKDWERVVPSRWSDYAGFDDVLGGRRSTRRHPPHTALEVWGFTAERSVNLRIQRGETVLDLAVGPVAAHTPEQLEALGGTLTPVYRE